MKVPLDKPTISLEQRFVSITLCVLVCISVKAADWLPLWLSEGGRWCSLSLSPHSRTRTHKHDEICKKYTKWSLTASLRGRPDSCCWLYTQTIHLALAFSICPYPGHHVPYAKLFVRDWCAPPQKLRHITHSCRLLWLPLGLPHLFFCFFFVHTFISVVFTDMLLFSHTVYCSPGC